MQLSTITYPAELRIEFPRGFSRKERLAAEKLKETYHHLLLEADDIRSKMQIAENHFNHLADEKEIDACIFQLRTTQCQYASALTRLNHLKTRMENLLAEN